MTDGVSMAAMMRMRPPQLHMSGARYATSDVVVDRQRVVSWDRGFDGRDQQVWGATAGPYEFVRRSSLLP